jgi:hypothetical protein
MEKKTLEKGGQLSKCQEEFREILKASEVKRPKSVLADKPPEHLKPKSDIGKENENDISQYMNNEEVDDLESPIKFERSYIS